MSKKILIIEDERDVVKVLAARLVGAGYEIVVASDGIQAVQFAHKEKPDLIILDLMLPAGGGLTVLENLEMSIYSLGTPVIVLTGIKDEEYKKKVIQRGVNAYIEKPYEPEDLLGAIRKLIPDKKGE